MAQKGDFDSMSVLSQSKIKKCTVINNFIKTRVIQRFTQDKSLLNWKQHKIHKPKNYHTNHSRIVIEEEPSEYKNNEQSLENARR
jgi:hypothetical protein